MGLYGEGGTTEPNVKVAGTARLHRAAPVWTAVLERTRQLALAKLPITIAPGQIEARLRKRFYTIDKWAILVAPIAVTNARKSLRCEAGVSNAWTSMTAEAA